MKQMKKFLSLLLAMIMILSMSVVAMAADDGTITVSNSTAGATYNVYKVFDATVSEDGTKIAYKAGSVLTENDYFETDAKLNVTVKEAAKDTSGNLTAKAIEWLKQKYVTGKTPVQTKTGNGSAITFENLPYGYYIVTSTVNNGAAVSVNSTMPDVTIIDKNQVPSWDNEPGTGDETGGDNNPGKVIIKDGKKYTVNSASFGDEIEFSISVNATSYVGEDLVTNYYIKDELANGFSEAQDIVVKINDEEKTLGTDYYLTKTGNKFEINVPFGTKYGSNAKIEVTYKATVLSTDDVVIAGNGNLNTANFTYATKTFDPDNPGEYDPENPGENDGTKKDYEDGNKKTTTTYVYAVGIKKVDPKGNALTGAEFSVNGVTAVPAKDTDGNVIEGVYEFCQTGAEGAVTQFKTNTKGVLIIKGLKAGTYTIKEEVAPLGYNLLTNTVDVTAAISETSTYTTTITTYYDADGNVVETKDEDGTEKLTTVDTNVVPLVVVNNAGTELPSTGGMGTTLFYVLGLILVIGAGVLLIVKRRMRTEK